MALKGTHLSDEQKKKSSEAHKGQIAWNRGIKGIHYSPKTEFKKGITFWNKGKHHTEETKKKISESNKGRILSEEERNRLAIMSANNKGKRLSEKHRKRISEAHKGKKRTEDFCKKNSECHKGQIPWNKGKQLSTETRQKISEHLKGKTSYRKGKDFPQIQGEKNHNWKGGISFEPYCRKFNERLKRRIRDRDNRTCQLCRVKENGRQLAVHHIHYDKQNCNPDLIALCPKCNNKVNNNRDYYEALFMQKLKDRGMI